MGLPPIDQGRVLLCCKCIVCHESTGVYDLSLSEVAIAFRVHITKQANYFLRNWSFLVTKTPNARFLAAKSHTSAQRSGVDRPQPSMGSHVGRV